MARSTSPTWIICLCGLALLATAIRVEADGLGGGGTLPTVDAQAEANQRERIDEAVALYDRWIGPPSVLAGSETPPKFPVYPMGGTLYRDTFPINFVDLDPSVGILDWDCTDFTYDGHDASDVDLRSFGEQAIGVPVFAAWDGTVMATHDGEEDMHTECAGEANYVAIDHGSGRRCYYLHFKQGSVAVEVGAQVRAGQQIGLVGSSGCSTGPHLHFATYDGTQVVEPFAGPCNDVESQWVDQVAINRDFYIRDLNVTAANIADYPGLPHDMPRHGMFIQGTRPVRFWVVLANLPSDSTWQVSFQRPDGALAAASNTTNFGNASDLRWSWWWWYWTLNMNQTGTWHILLTINDELVAEAPFTVVSSGLHLVNRAPNPISVNLEPALPSEDDVLVCRVDTDLIFDDPDYEIVRYLYEWRVDDVPVRTITSAAHADMLPRSTATNGQVVRCTVTPMDASTSGPSAVGETLVADTHPGDCDGNRIIDYTDLAGIQGCITGPDDPTEPACSCLDFDGDGDVDLRDVGHFVASQSTRRGR